MCQNNSKDVIKSVRESVFSTQKRDDRHLQSPNPQNKDKSTPYKPQPVSSRRQNPLQHHISNGENMKSRWVINLKMIQHQQGLAL